MRLGSVAYPQQSLAHLVAAEHFFAVNLLEPQHFIGLDLAVQLARLHGDSNVVHKLHSRKMIQIFLNTAHWLSLSIELQPLRGNGKNVIQTQ